jgi:hypothetical protein
VDHHPETTTDAPAHASAATPTHRARPTREEYRELFRLRRVGALTALLETRSDLRGVSSVADHLDDAVRWSA